MTILNFDAWLLTSERYKGFPLSVAQSTTHIKQAYNNYAEKIVGSAEKMPVTAQTQNTLMDAIAENHFEQEKLVLPSWSDSVQGVPNGILRSALFGVIRRGKRPFLQGQQMASVDGVSVLFTGPRLDQADLDVWEHCLHIARSGKFTEFSAHAFLQGIGRDTGKSQRDWLENAMRRLMSSVVEIKDGNKVYAGQLIHHWARNTDTGRHVIEINPAIIKLYGTDGWTALEWAERHALRKQPLAQWLHGFYSTHKTPYPYKVETIHDLCGSENAQLSGFRRELKDASNAVAVVTGWKCAIDETDKLCVSKTKKISKGA